MPKRKVVSIQPGTAGELAAWQSILRQEFTWDANPTADVAVRAAVRIAAKMLQSPGPAREAATIAVWLPVEGSAADE